MDEMPYKSNRNVFYACHSHVVWCPMYRRKVLIPAIEERLKHIIYEGCEEHHAEVEELEVVPDHVQRYGERRSAIWHSPPDAPGQRPFFSHGSRQEFPSLKRKLPPLWTNSYFVSTTGGAPLSVIKQHIEQQKHV